MTRTVLILGGSGRFGRHATSAFTNAGWQVRQFDRKTDRLTTSVEGVDVIVNAWNPAYPDWERQVPALHADVIAAARTVDATVIVPGNVYVYGPDRPGTWALTTPHAAANRLGRVRLEMEKAYRQSVVRTILLRAGDFIDTAPSGNWFDQIMVSRMDKGIFTYPGDPDTEHAWAFLPDLADAAVMLAEKRAGLNRFEEVLFPGYTLTGKQMAETLSRVTRQPVRLKRFNWVPVQLLAPFWKMGRCLLEMRYLWNVPHALDERGLAALLPAFSPTPLDQALARALPEMAVTARPVQNSRSAQTIL